MHGERERDQLAAGADPEERTGDMPTNAGMWGTGAGKGKARETQQ